MISVPGLIRRARKLIAGNDPAPPGPATWAVTLGDYCYVIRIWSPVDWAGLTGSDRPTEARQGNRPGWWAAVDDAGPSAGLLAHWRQIAEAGVCVLDPDGYPLNPKTREPFKGGPYNPRVRRDGGRR